MSRANIKYVRRDRKSCVYHSITAEICWSGQKFKKTVGFSPLVRDARVMAECAASLWGCAVLGQVAASLQVRKAEEEMWLSERNAVEWDNEYAETLRKLNLNVSRLKDLGKQVKDNINRRARKFS